MSPPRRGRRWAAAAQILLVVLVVCGVVPTVGTTKSYACSCVAAPVSELVQSAQVVVQGTVSEVSPPRILPSTRVVRYTIEVHRAWRGVEPGTGTLVVTDARGMCGLADKFAVDQDVLIAAYVVDGELRADLCGGSGPADEERVAQVVAGLGAGRVVDRRAPNSGPGIGIVMPVVLGAATIVVVAGIAIGVKVHRRRTISR